MRASGRPRPATRRPTSRSGRRCAKCWTPTPDPQAGGRDNNARRRHGAGQHQRAGETVSNEVGTGVHRAPCCVNRRRPRRAVPSTQDPVVRHASVGNESDQTAAYPIAEVEAMQYRRGTGRGERRRHQPDRQRRNQRLVVHHRGQHAADSADDQKDQHDELGRRLVERVEPPVVEAQPDSGADDPNPSHDQDENTALEVLVGLGTATGCAGAGSCSDDDSSAITESGSTACVPTGSGCAGKSSVKVGTYGWVGSPDSVSGPASVVPGSLRVGCHPMGGRWRCVPGTAAQARNPPGSRRELRTTRARWPGSTPQRRHPAPPR